MKILANEHFNLDQRIITLNLDYKTLSTYSKPLVFGESFYGYHRKINEHQISKLASKIKRSNMLLTPSPIILSSQPSSMVKCLTSLDIDVDSKCFILDSEKVFGSFRFIVGYPVIKAFEKLLSDATLDAEFRLYLENYQFQVSIVVLDNSERYKELEILDNTLNYENNSLTYLAKRNYELINLRDNIDYKKQLKIRIIFYLADNDLAIPNSCWKNAIKLDAHVKSGLINKNSFGDSIDTILDVYMKINKEFFNTINKQIENNSITPFEIQDNLDMCARELLANLIVPAWNMIYKKWKSAFSKETFFQNDIMYDVISSSDYYIQKTQGVKALNGILGDTYKISKDFSKTLDSFQKTLSDSKLVTGDWHCGYKMHGYNSAAGVKLIKSMIMARR